MRVPVIIDRFVRDGAFVEFDGILFIFGDKRSDRQLLFQFVSFANSSGLNI